MVIPSLESLNIMMAILASILHQPIPKKSRETDSPCFDAQGPLGFFEAHLQKRSRSRWGKPPAR